MSTQSRQPKNSAVGGKKIGGQYAPTHRAELPDISDDDAFEALFAPTPDSPEIEEAYQKSMLEYEDYLRRRQEEEKEMLHRQQQLSTYGIKQVPDADQWGTPCSRCGGSGIIHHYTAVNGGICFACDGQKFTLTAPTADEAIARAEKHYAAVKQQEEYKANQKNKAFLKAHTAWLKANPDIENIETEFHSLFPSLPRATDTPTDTPMSTTEKQQWSDHWSDVYRMLRNKKSIINDTRYDTGHAQRLRDAYQRAASATNAPPST